MDTQLEIEIKIVEAQIAQLRVFRSRPSAPIDYVEVVLNRERALLAEKSNLEARLPLSTAA